MNSVQIETEKGLKAPEKEKKNRSLSLLSFRKIVQFAWGLLTNGYIKGFLPGGPSIYEGPLKRFCVPGMNCYSCPGALGACPIGALQSVLNARHRKFPFYVLGYLMAVGVICGRLICGWLCLFGLIEELLYKIPTPKIKIPEKIDKPLRYLKYAVLFVLVILLPLFYRTDYGAGEPFFCKCLCPVGTLEGGVPLVLLNDMLRPALGWLFRWKMLILILCLLSCIFIYRPFCKYLCPLGAFYALFQKISLVKIKLKKDACINCGACAKVCGMNVDPHKIPNSAECIRCGECLKKCPTGALSFEGAGKKLVRAKKKA